jgi:D-alanyl-D-alanine carboxypeptidase (penicillin-binding protein 5/6)
LGRAAARLGVARPGAAWLGALPALLLLVLLVPFLASFTTTGRGFREPGLLPGGVPGGEPGVAAAGVVTAADLDRLRRQPPAPPIGARGAIVWDATTGVDLYSKAADERLSPASTTKILTALLVIEWGRLDQQVTIEERDYDEWDDTVMCLAPGDVVTVEDLLYGILLPSGTDAALAAARTVGAALLAGAEAGSDSGRPAGSDSGRPGDPVARFVQEMNGRAARLGLANTQFRNPHGNDAEGHYSSARDLALIAAAAMNDPLFARIANTGAATRTAVAAAPTSATCSPWATRETVDGRTSFLLTTTNGLLGEREGLHGVKTGTTAQCGRCLVAAQWGPGGRLIAVVLGSEDRYADAAALFDWATAAYRWIPLGRGAEPPGLGPALARWGVGFRDSRTVVVPAWEAPMVRYRLLLDAGGGDARGRVVFVAGPRELFSLPVYATAAEGRPATPPPARR